MSDTNKWTIFVPLMVVVVMTLMQIGRVQMSSIAQQPQQQVAGGVKHAASVGHSSKQLAQTGAPPSPAITTSPAPEAEGKQQPIYQQGSATRRRSDVQEDDQMPLAAINNHSNRNNINNNASNNNVNTNSNNINQLRPPQYVDVSALVGRNASISNSNAYASSQSGNSLLSPKSRSGLPECATQQDGHTIELTRKFDKRIYTQIKTCEPLREVRACKSPTDWTLLALQSERSGKAHYVVVCKCPTWAQLEGPYTHNHPPYANIPGIRVYGMLCIHQTARSSSAQTYATYNPALNVYPEFPWSEAISVLNTTNLASTLDSS